ncbi:ABC transporter permease subunit [Bacillus massilinigeriensis]|uniref:ABC transporter permease subunit n=1 Tax=Bacillus mediterraneensis TaxID=1805474 RepID=UPI0008F8412B|nr:ABC transporter permease subunit [Bacillus mediterraneensis]
MNAFIAFANKELTESVRTYKLLIITAVFLLFGMLNPVMAKIMPELLSSFMPDGMTIALQDPSALDSWAQFYKNMSTQIIVFIIVYSGVMATELSKGTLVNMLTKGLSRKTVILSKFSVTSIIWTLSYALCFGVTYGYTLYLLPGELPNLYLAAFSMWLFGILLNAVMFFGSVLFANIYGALLTTGGFTILLMLINIIPKVKKISPFKLVSENMLLLTGELDFTDLRISIAISCLLIIGFMIGAVGLFNKREI